MPAAVTDPPVATSLGAYLAQAASMTLGPLGEALETMATPVTDYVPVSAELLADSPRVEWRELCRPVPQRREVHERCTYWQMVSDEFLRYAGRGVLRDAISRLAELMAAAFVERHVPELPREQSNLNHRPVILRNLTVTYDRDPVEILSWESARMPATAPTRYRVTGQDLHGNDVEIETDGELRVDQDFARMTYSITLTSGATTTITWAEGGTYETHYWPHTATITSYTGNYYNVNIGTGSTAYYNPQVGAHFARHNTVYPRAELRESHAPYLTEPVHAEPIPLTPEQQRAADEVAERLRREAVERRERERVEAAERQAEYDRRTAERAREQEVARGRARELLYSLLTPEQRDEHTRLGTITVRGSAGNLFRLETEHYAGNVGWVDESGDLLGTMCAHPRSQDLDGHVMPADDIFAGQVLALQTDERDFVRIANHYSGMLPVYPPPDPVPLRIEQAELIEALA